MAFEKFLAPYLPADEAPELVRALNDTFFRLQSALTALAEGQVPEVHVIPSKLRGGMVVLADGTDWNPGSGRGVYCYDEGTATWRFLG